MQNYIKTILSAFKTWMQKKIKDSTADWNENDSSKSSYVKNRTHWEEQDGTIHKLDKKYLELPDNIATTDNVESAKQEVLNLVNETKGAANTALTNAATAQTTADTAQSTADIALANAATAQNTADAKMNKNNPIGSGSFSMNRYEDSDIGDYSMTSGYGSVANHFAENVSGQYNIYEQPKFWVDTHLDEMYTTLTFFKGYAYYYSDGYSFDQSTGVYKLINPIYISKDDIQQLNNRYIILKNKRFEPNTTEGSRLMLVSYTRNTSTNYYTATGEVSQSIPDSSKKGTYTHIVGNGTSDTERSNAYTLDWEGNAWYSGDVYVGSTSGTNRDEGSKKLATVEEVQELASQISSQSYVAQTEAPEDKNLLWVDLDDESDDEGLADVIQAAIADVKNVAIPVPEVAKVGQTIVVKEIDEDGKPTAWETIDFPSGGEKWVSLADITFNETTATYEISKLPDDKPWSSVRKLYIEGYAVRDDNGQGGQDGVVLYNSYDAGGFYLCPSQNSPGKMGFRTMLERVDDFLVSTDIMSDHSNTYNVLIYKTSYSAVRGIKLSLPETKQIVFKSWTAAAIFGPGSTLKVYAVLD